MAESERADTLLRVVNGDALLLPEWDRLCGAQLIGPFSIAGADDLKVPLIDRVRRALRVALEGAIREPETALPEIDKNARAIVEGRVVSVAGFSASGVPRDRVIAHSIGAAVIFALRVVLDPHKPFRQRLRQCAWPECGRFDFGAPPATRGQPPNFYCSDAHRDQHRKAQNKERAAASRRGIPVEKYRKRQLRSRHK